METISVDLKKLSDVVDKYVVKKSKYSKLKSKLVGLEFIISSAYTLIHNKQYVADNLDLVEKK